MELPLECVELPGDAIEVGRVGDAWGVKGWFKVLAYSADPEAVFSSKLWYLLAPERGTAPFEGARLLRIREARDHSGVIVACVNGIDERDGALALRGCRIFVRRASFPSTKPDEFYWVDLIGLAVINREGVALGHVRDLLQTAAQTVLVVGYPHGDAQRERLIPFVASHVDAVDQVGRCIRVDWQADY